MILKKYRYRPVYRAPRTCIFLYLYFSCIFVQKKQVQAVRGVQVQNTDTGFFKTSISSFNPEIPRKPGFSEKDPRSANLGLSGV